MRERTKFGARLFAARTHARLTQAQLSKAAGISQGTLGELEWIGEGSSAVVRLAMACGVRPEWLAEEEGDMLDPRAWPFTIVAEAEILELDATERGIVEGAVLAALERIHSPNQNDLERFRASHASWKDARRRTAAKQKPSRSPTTTRFGGFFHGRDSRHSYRSSAELG